MNTVQFWLKVGDIFHLYHGDYRHGILTDEEQLENVSEFLTDMDALASEWYNRESKKEMASDDNKTDS